MTKLAGHAGPRTRVSHLPAGDARGGFTLVELVVVITVIILVLAIAIPGLSVMNAEARLSSAEQTISAVTTRAYYLAASEPGSMTAVRFFPGQWDVSIAATTAATTRQHMAIYRWVGSAVQETFPGSGTYRMQLGEYFQRVTDAKGDVMAASRLPEDVWVAPVEALRQDTEHNGQYWLDGPLSTGSDGFRYNAETAHDLLLDADDFLVICDAKTGVWGGMPRPHRLRAYSPLAGYEVDRNPQNANDIYQRFHFSGVVAYPREAFASLGERAAPANRQTFLRERGRPYLVHRFSGGLVAGAQRSP